LVESFGLGHFWLLKKLESRGTPLGLQRTLIQPVSPFWQAVSSCVGVHEPNTLTYVIRETTKSGVMAGVAQIWERRGRPEAEIIYIAPALSTNPDIQSLWGRLLSQVCVEAGERGVQRLFADISRDGGEAEVFRQVGFTAYAREEILRLDEIPPVPRRDPPVDLRRLRSEDAGQLLDLYASVTPRLVQQAEGQGPAQWHINSNHSTFWGEEAYILEDQQSSKIVGYLQVKPGTVGHWLEMTLAPIAWDDGERLLEFGLSRIADWPARPVYTAVREYQGGLLPILYAKGFDSCARQVSMVKHTTVLVKDPFPKLLPVIEKRVGPSTPTVTLLNGDSACESPSHPVTAMVGSSHE
jgi:hypothetical protein